MRKVWLAALVGFLAGVGRARASTDVTRYHVDAESTGANLAETVLTPASVNATGFGKLFSHAVDGAVYAQPLLLRAVPVPGKGTHDVVYVATEHDSLYAFDANDAKGANADPLWQRSFIDPAQGVVPVPQADVLSPDLAPEIGITGTPVIDADAGTLFLVARTRESSGGATRYVQRLHAIDVTSGAERPGSPVEIAPVVAGYGDGTDGAGHIPFNPLTQHQRTALALANGRVYVTWASHGDNGPYHGWVVAYDAATLAQREAFNTSSNFAQSGIWQSGAGPSADAEGHLYFTTGNGEVKPASNAFGEALMHLGPDLAVRDFFVPYNFQHLNDVDADLGSGGVLVLPDQPGPHPHLLVAGGKEGVLYLVDRDNLGGFDAAADHVLQKVEAPSAAGDTNDVNNGLFSTAAYWNGAIYYARNGDALKRRPLANGELQPVASQSSNSYGFPGATPVISAAGSEDGIVWTLEQGNPATLRAHDALDLGRLLFEDHPVGGGTKFSVPVVANGKVYVAGQSALTVFGLLNVPSAPPAAPEGLQASADGPNAVRLAWTDRADSESGFVIERSLDGQSYTMAARIGVDASAFRDDGLTPNTAYTYRVKAFNAAGESAPTAVARANTAPEADASTVAHWPFDEGAELVAHDYSGHGHTGAIAGEVSWIPGHIGAGALAFHGTGHAVSHVTIPDAASLRFTAAQSFSLTAWVNLASVPGHAVQVLSKSRGQGNPYELGVDGSGRWTFTGPTGALAGGQAGTGWHQLIAVQDGTKGTRTLALDGAVVAQGPAQAADGPGELWIGGAQGVVESFPGQIDDVYVFALAVDPAKLGAQQGDVPHASPAPAGAKGCGGCGARGDGLAGLVLLVLALVRRRPTGG